jgi:hypothetical protein
LVGTVDNKVIADSKITASTTWRNHKNYGQGAMYRSRLNYRHTSWCAGKNDDKQWIEYDLGEPKWITAIQTQGRANTDQWVTFYKLDCKEDETSDWKPFPGKPSYEGNRDRSSIHENRVVPTKCLKVRIKPESWQQHVSMRADILGCSGEDRLAKVCVDKPYLNAEQKDCRTIERELGAKETQKYCTEKGHKAWFTALSANQACCACGGGDMYFTSKPPSKNNTVDKKAPVAIIKGGTGYAPPHLCQNIDETGGMVCERSSRLQHVTIKNAGIWHQMMTIDVQTEFGFALSEFVTCYKQYEFSTFQNLRHLLVPPYTPKSLYDWDTMSATVKLRAGDQYVLQWETLHNPDGYTVHMAGQHKKAYVNNAPVIYKDDFFKNKTLLDELARDRDPYSAKKLDLALGLDMYKQAHQPLLDTAGSPNSAANWGYLQGNASFKTQYWYPGSFQVLVSTKGVTYGQNALGPWSGYKKDIREMMPTRPLNGGSVGAKPGGFSHLETHLSWTRWDSVPAPPGQPKVCETCISRLMYLTKYCDMEAGALTVGDYFSDSAEALDKLSKHPDVVKKTVTFKNALKFSWSAWPQDVAGGKPKTHQHAEFGVGNVTIETHWEVTLDEDVDFITKLNISGVLKFADKPGCCKLVARYIVIGPMFGRLEAGTAAAPITQGHAHIVLKGHPLTPQIKEWFPHLSSSAKWLKNKFIAVQGTLNLYGENRAKTWVKLAQGVSVGATKLTLDTGSDFRVGDSITLDAGFETRKVVDVSGDVLTLDSPLKNSYKGLDDIHLGDQATKGMRAVAVGLIGGHRVIVEGEDTEGIPMCDKD